MSRIGKQPIVIPKGVAAKLEGNELTIKGPKGQLGFLVGDGRFTTVEVKITDGEIAVARNVETRQSYTEQGLVRSLIQNMVTGVTDGFNKVLEIVGVGYKAEAKGKALNLNLGFSHPVVFELPEGIQAVVDKQTRITISGSDKQLVGEIAAQIRRIRPPEPYKGKGVRYAGEIVHRKVGKAAAGATGG